MENIKSALHELLEYEVNPNNLGTEYLTHKEWDNIEWQKKCVGFVLKYGPQIQKLLEMDKRYEIKH